MTPGFPSVSRLDSLRYNFGHVLPRVMQGTFTPRERWVRFWSRHHPDPLSARFAGTMRNRYGGYVYLNMLGTRTLLVLDPQGIRHVLENSPTIYAEPRLKRKAMSHFQPDAVTISRGLEWEDRRRFNEAVLDTGRPLHSDAATFARVAREEVAAMRSASASRLGWREFESLFERLTLRTILGNEAREAHGVTSGLRAMMKESNSPVGLGNSRHFEPYRAALQEHLQAARPGSLAGRCPHAPRTERTHPESQVTHWIFAMRDTLAVNTLRALALIAAHPEAQARVLQEVAGAPPGAEGIDGLVEVEGCLQEAMRLWPTTPILLREAVTEDELGGRVVAAGTPVLILNGYTHRNRDVHPHADTFAPEIWFGRTPNFLFNHLSNGPQACAGRELALFLGKAVLSSLLTGSGYDLLDPSIGPARPLPHALDPYRIRIAPRAD